MILRRIVQAILSAETAQHLLSDNGLDEITFYFVSLSFSFVLYGLQIILEPKQL